MKQYLVIGISLLFALQLTSACAEQAPKVSARQGNNTSIENVDGRTYRLYTPSKARAKMPLLLVLHGGFGKAEFIQRRLGMDALANKHGFLVVYPNGTEGRMAFMRDKRMWNAGKCCGIAKRQNVNDVGFLSSIIDQLVSAGQVDAEQVYIMGHSNGAMMSYAFACSRADKIKGVIGVSGALVRDQCPSAAGLKILQVHGQQDKSVPYGGGTARINMTGVDYRSANATKQVMEAAGAQVTLLSVTQAAHELPGIDRAMQQQYGVSLAQRVVQFMRVK